AGVGGLLYVFGWLVSFLLAALGGGGRASVANRLVMDGLAFAGSYLVFCRPDRLRSAVGFRPSAFGHRLSAGRPHGPPEALPAASRQRSAVGRLAWLAWRQGRSDLAVLSAAALVLGLAFAPYMVGLWPVWTLLVGAVFGTGVWRGEQAEDSYRFLSAQRLP